MRSASSDDSAGAQISKSALKEKSVGSEVLMSPEEIRTEIREDADRTIRAASPELSAKLKKVSNAIRGKTQAEEDEENDPDAIQIKALQTPRGSRVSFGFVAQSFVEFTIAMKAATDLCTSFRYFDGQDHKLTLQTGFAQQQECTTSGTAMTEVNGEVVSVELSYSPEKGLFAIAFHSYSKKAAESVARQFKHLCRTSNFYRGQHLMADEYGSKTPLTFLAPPTPPKIYGLQDIRDSLYTNVVDFFRTPELHVIASQRGVLMHGRPGSGKSSLTAQIKCECLKAGLDITVIELSTKAMQSVGCWYNLIEEWLAPALIVMEDYDLVAGTRDIQAPGSQAVTTELLNSIQGNNRKKGIMVTLATTNRVECLDAAAIRSRRMDQIYRVDGMEAEFQIQLFRDNGIDLPQEALVAATTILGRSATGADVSSVAVSALLYVKRKGLNMQEAFNRSLDEWKRGHATQLRTDDNGERVGFNPLHKR